MNRRELRKALISTLILAIGAIVIAEICWGFLAVFLLPAY